MDRFDTRRVAEGLTAYAIERQHGFERRQDGIPSWMEQRRFWTDAILQGMAKLDGRQPDPALMERFDRELKQDQGCYFFTPATRQMQKDTIRELRRFVSALEDTGDDRRRQVDVVWKLLEDMSSHLPWARADNGLDHAHNQAERALRRMTARMPIRFTRILLGGDAGPHWGSGFASGSVIDEDGLRQTDVYREMVQDFPEVKSWPALCTIYTGGGQYGTLISVPASDFDLEIINRAGYDFLKEWGVRWMCGSCQMMVDTTPAMDRQQEETGPEMGLTM